MANSFKNTSGKNTFGVFYESQDASEYIYNKKAKATYCVPNNCTPSVNFVSERDHLLYNRSNILTFSPCLNSINSSNLCTNLITKIDLKNIPVVQNFYPQGSDTSVPSTIINSNSITPYLDYNIDPCGNLFGNTVCGINNFLNYKSYTSFYFSYTLSGSYYITSDENYDTIITFTGNGTINITNNYSNRLINYIVVGGGGGGSGGDLQGGGGGGGGEVLIGDFESGFSSNLESGVGKYNIIIGQGGRGGLHDLNYNGVAGESTSFIGNNVNVVASGGNPGYAYRDNVGNLISLNGGNSGARGLGGLGLGGVGNQTGGNGINGGGGGGGQANSGIGGNGGYNNINPDYGGGGGGGGGYTVAPGHTGNGVGGGGNGASNEGPYVLYAIEGFPNTGGGGGGGLYYHVEPGDSRHYSTGAAGGSGVVILSFNNSTRR